MGQASASHQQLVVCAFVLCCCLVTAKDGGQKEELGDWDYYARLGIPSTASAQEIKRAYHKQSIKWHPDKNNGSKEAERTFIRIQQAYEVLKDDTRRRAYDAAWRHSRTSSQSPGEQGAGHGKGDAFSFEMNGQQLTFEELFALLKQWEVQVPDNVRDATRLFKSFVDSITDTNIREFIDNLVPVVQHDSWGQRMAKRTIRFFLWYGRGMIKTFLSEVDFENVRVEFSEL